MATTEANHTSQLIDPEQEIKELHKKYVFSMDDDPNKFVTLKTRRKL